MTNISMAGSSLKDMCCEATEEEELAGINYELDEIEAKLLSLQERKEYLLGQRQKLKDAALLKKSLTLAGRNWQSDFPWSKRASEVLQTVFKLPGFRPHQLPTINAVLSKENVILLMPTGGGKSLCYQLPALVSNGVTLVVSPLIALMEDQLLGLRKLSVNAAMLNASSTKEEVNSIQQAMIDKNSKLKLLYVTPEKLAKSKRFMTKLQKMYGLKRLALLAIDEVHCCSQWGHDFRPDYKFLGILKAMFPDVPILGLTATATSKVIVDVQKMLNIQGCLVFKASFNRPNLYYEVRPKSSNQKECYEELADLLKFRFAGRSGIVYATSIKDCEELMQELRGRNLRVGCYHANLDAALRSKVHEKWLNGQYQAVVATIAFGLGIDKPDVRFVIHHALSKSMENFYQESGRAGRDGQPADCILFYRFADVFRLSTMVFTQQTGLENLYGIVAYCLDKIRCRRSIIASHFDEGWKSKDCNAMCDHCRRPHEKKEAEVSQYCRALYQIIAHAASNDAKLTGQMLLDAWFGKGKANIRVSSVPVPKFDRGAAEAIVAHLLVEGYLKEDFHFTPYSTISYIKRGPRAAFALSEKNHITMTVSGKSLAAKAPAPSAPTTPVSAAASETPPARQEKRDASGISPGKETQRKESVVCKSNPTTPAPTNHANKSRTAVVDLCGDSDSDGEAFVDLKLASMKRTKRKISSDSMDDCDADRRAQKKKNTMTNQT